MTDFSDPAARLALAERVGPAEYTRLFTEHRAASVIATVGGHALRPVASRFGRLIAVGDTGRAFSTKEAAETFATLNPVEA